MLFLRLSIDTDNDAFVEDTQTEVHHILVELARRIEVRTLDDLRDQEFRLSDSNGNHVGKAFVNYEPPKKCPMPDDRIKVFVSQMSEVDIRQTLEDACGIQTYAKESLPLLCETLCLCLAAGDTSMESVVQHFHPKYTLPE